MLYTGRILYPIIGRGLYLVTGLAPVNSDISKLRNRIEKLEATRDFGDLTPGIDSPLDSADKEGFHAIPSGALAIDGSYYSPFGLRSSTGYMPGDKVIIFDGSVDDIYVIIGSVPETTDGFASTLDYEYIDKTLKLPSHSVLPELILTTDYGFGSQALWDTYAWDHIVTSALGVRFGCSAFSTIMAASSLCSLELFHTGSFWKARHILYEEDSADSHTVINPTGFRTDHSEDTSWIYSLRLGVAGSSDITMMLADPDGWEYKHPLWVRSRMMGESVDGEIEIFRDGDLSGTNLTPVDEDPQNLLAALKIAKIKDGVFAVQARNSIIFQKSCYISDYFIKDPLAEKDEDVTQPPDLIANGPAGDSDPLFAEDYAAYMLNQRIFGKQQQRKEWGLISEEDIKEDEEVKSPKEAFEQDTPTTIVKDGKLLYLSLAGIYVLPDGSIIITDGYGSELTMSHGNIRISCPGQIFTTPGGSSITLAGRDIISRADNGIDISASKADIHMKAERNLKMLAGVSGSGGILLHDKSSGSYDYDHVGEEASIGGIVFKTESRITSLSSEYYMENTRIANMDFGSRVLFRADKAGFECDRFYVKLDADKIFSISKSLTYIPTNLEVERDAIFNRDLISIKRIIGKQIAATKSNPSFSDDMDLPEETRRRYLYSIPEDDLDDYAKQVRDQRDAINDDTSSMISEIEDWTEELPDPDEITFTFRNEEQYGSSEFYLRASRWQQMLSSGKKLTRDVIQDTSPYPGHSRVSTPGSFITPHNVLMSRKGLFCYNESGDITLSFDTNKTFSDDYKVP